MRKQTRATDKNGRADHPRPGECGDRIQPESSASVDDEVDKLRPCDLPLDQAIELVTVKILEIELDLEQLLDRMAAAKRMSRARERAGL